MILLLIIMFLGILLFPSLSIIGVTKGMILWATKVFPALFPAMLLTAWILSIKSKNSSSAYVYIIIIGLLCGFPTGAFACGQYHKTHPSEQLCPKIIGYCNISGFAFILNYIYYNYLRTYIAILSFFIIIYLPPIILIFVAIIKQISSNRNQRKFNLTVPATFHIHIPKSNFIKNVSAFQNALETSISQSIKLGGYIIFFSCLSEYCANIFLKNSFIGYIICGILEITSGIAKMSTSPFSPNIILIFIIAINSFGGISTLMQTYSVISNSGISIKKYIYQKLQCTVLSVFIAIFLIYVPKL